MAHLPTTITVEIRARWPWWWTWVYFPLTKLGLSMGLPLSEDRFIADAKRALKVNVVEVINS